MLAPCRTISSRTDSGWEANGSRSHLSNTSEKHSQNTEQTIQTKIFETPEPNTYDNPLGLQDLPRSVSDAHVDPMKESVQTTKETWKVQQLNSHKTWQTALIISWTEWSETENVDFKGVQPVAPPKQS